MIPQEITNMLITKICNDLSFIDPNLQGSVFDKHIELRDNYRTQKLNGKDYKLNPNDYTNLSAVQEIKSIIAACKLEYWDMDTTGVSLINENTHKYNISYVEPFMEIMSALHLLIQKSFKDTSDNKFETALKKLESFHQKFFEGGFGQQEAYVDGIQNAINLMNQWHVPDVYGDDWLDTCITDDNSIFHALVAEVVNQTFPNPEQAWGWVNSWFFCLLGLLTVSVGKYLYGINNNGMLMYGHIEDAINWNQSPDPLFNFNVFNLFDIEDDNTMLVTNNLLRPIGIIEDLVYQQLNQNDINTKTGDYIKFTVNQNSQFNEQLIKVGNWLVTKNDLNDEPNRWIISESNHNCLTDTVDVTADQVSTVILSAIKNRRSSTYFLDQIHELVELDYRGSDVLNPPSGDPTGAQYDLKRYMDYLRELTTGWDGADFERFNPKIMVDMINDQTDPHYGWFKDVLRVFQNSGKLVPFIFTEADLQEYTVDVKSADLYSAYRESEAEYSIAYDYEWNFEMDSNNAYTTGNNVLSAGQGYWCDTWDKDHYTGQYTNCPSSFSSQLVKRNAFFVSPKFARDSLSFKPTSDTNIMHKNMLGQINYKTSSLPDLSDADKQRTYRDKTIFDERRNYYDAAVTEFNDKIYSGNFNNYKVTLSLIEYINRFGKTDVNVGDQIIINIKGEFLMTTVTQTTKSSDKLLDAKIEIDTDYKPFIGGTNFLNSGIQSYDINLYDIFGVG
jgi:hypothetical protein